MSLVIIVRLKKGEERRIFMGHPWIYSNEIDTRHSPLKLFKPGQLVRVETYNQLSLGIGYINPHSLIAIRLLSRNEKESINQEFFTSKLNAALTLRIRLFSQPYYRLVFGESDQLPGLVIDRFGDDFVMQTNTVGMENLQPLIVEALCNVLPNINSVLLKNDSSVREYENLPTYTKTALGHPPTEIQLEENNIPFIAPLAEGQKTGWFYDHRMNRARLKNYVENKNVLDVFSYLGGFAIQAGVFGAKHIDCIDVSSLAREYIEKNAQLNKLSQKIKIINEDAFLTLKTLLNNAQSYDVIILDPPAFIKKSKDRKEGLIAYQRINELALRLLSSSGILISCSCSMHVSMNDFIEILQKAVYRTKSMVQILEKGHQGPDHPIHLCIPETDYLKAVILRKV